MSKSSPKEAWDNKTRFVVYGQALLMMLAWGRMIHLAHDKYWDAEQNVEKLKQLIEPKESSPVPNFMIPFMERIVLSLFTDRYLLFFFHVSGAFIWWNAYFLQLIPSFRRKYKVLHRRLGRVLMVCAMAQSISGAGLAYMGKSTIIKLTSYMLAISVVYSAAYAWYFARKKDFAKHKYWSMRLVGYLQSIALQRFYHIVLIACYRLNLFGLYPPFDDDDPDIALKIFDDTFVAAVMTAMLVTEWYLASYYGWTETTPPKPKEE